MQADTAIWKLFLEGDELSFETLMKHHFTPLFHYGTKYTADSELVKDCIQELFIGLWEKRQGLNKDVNARPYLMASLRRILHRKLQAQDRWGKRETRDMSDYFDFQVSAEQKMIDTETIQAQSKKIGQAVASLPRRQKEVIYLKFFQNFSREEIAEIMGNSPQTVSNLLQLALKKLRCVL